MLNDGCVSKILETEEKIPDRWYLERLEWRYGSHCIRFPMAIGLPLCLNRRSRSERSPLRLVTRHEIFFISKTVLYKRLKFGFFRSQISQSCGGQCNSPQRWYGRMGNWLVSEGFGKPLIDDHCMS